MTLRGKHFPGSKPAGKAFSRKRSMDSLIALLPQKLAEHIDLNHSKYRTYEELRVDVGMWLENKVGVKLTAPGREDYNDPMDVDALGKGQYKGKKGLGRGRGQVTTDKDYDKDKGKGHMASAGTGTRTTAKATGRGQ